MHQIIIVASIILISFNTLSAQENYDELVQYELEYFNAKTERVKTASALKKLNLLINLDSLYLEKCNYEIDRVTPSLLSPIDKETFYWNATIVNLLDKTGAEIIYAQRYAKLTNDKSIAAQIIYLLAIAQSNTGQQLEAYITNKELRSILVCQRSKKALKERKKGYEIASAFVPGSGMMLKGHYTKGATSLALHSLTGVLVYSLLKNKLYGNALGYGTLILAKLYTGNIIFTRKLSEKNNYKQTQKKISQCESALADLITQYPVLFK